MVRVSNKVISNKAGVAGATFGTWSWSPVGAPFAGSQADGRRRRRRLGGRVGGHLRCPSQRLCCLDQRTRDSKKAPRIAGLASLPFAFLPEAGVDAGADWLALTLAKAINWSRGAASYVRTSEWLPRSESSPAGRRQRRSNDGLLLFCCAWLPAWCFAGRWLLLLPCELNRGAAYFCDWGKENVVDEGRVAAVSREAREADG
ncbi:hypothetical protein GGR56DRAFT_406805 [Xylariaceae sp. FL0804]|nr:hypothetical protein GGR56DRAFT_406805 [Xylariaceae sp. FL0804]